MEINIEPGVGQYFTQWRFDHLKEMADDLHERAGIQTFRIWYDGYHDYHCMEFATNGHTYKLEYYKIITLQRDDQKEKRYFCSYQERWEIPVFFAREHHKRPWPCYKENHELPSPAE